MPIENKRLIRFDLRSPAAGSGLQPRPSLKIVKMGRFGVKLLTGGLAS